MDVPTSSSLSSSSILPFAPTSTTISTSSSPLTNNNNNKATLVKLLWTMDLHENDNDDDHRHYTNDDVVVTGSSNDDDLEQNHSIHSKNDDNGSMDDNHHRTTTFQSILRPSNKNNTDRDNDNDNNNNNDDDDIISVVTNQLLFQTLNDNESLASSSIWLHQDNGSSSSPTKNVVLPNHHHNDYHHQHSPPPPQLLVPLQQQQQPLKTNRSSNTTTITTTNRVAIPSDNWIVPNRNCYDQNNMNHHHIIHNTTRAVMTNHPMIVTTMTTTSPDMVVRPNVHDRTVVATTINGGSRNDHYYFHNNNNMSSTSLTYSISPPPSSNNSIDSSDCHNNDPDFVPRKKYDTTTGTSTKLLLHPLVVALCSVSEGMHNFNHSDQEDVAADGHNDDVDNEIQLSPLTFVSVSSFPENTTTGSTFVHDPQDTRTNNSSHNQKHMDRIASSNTIYTLEQRKASVNPNKNGIRSPIVICNAMVQEYHIIQTLRHQSLVYNNRTNYNYGTTYYYYYGTMRLFDYLMDMNVDLHYIMTNKMKTYYMEQPPYDHPGTILVPNELDEKVDDPVIQWEKYMDHHHHGPSNSDTQHRWPIFTYTLMILCTIVLILSFQLNQWTMESFRYNSSFGPSSETLIQMGVLSTKLLLEKEDTDGNGGTTIQTIEWYRIITTIGIHGGILHWICSMIAILYIGVPMERRYGTILIGSIFMVTSMAANVCTLIYSPFEFILSPMGGICTWYGLRCSIIFNHYGILRQLYAPPFPSFTTMVTVPTSLTIRNESLSRTRTKAHKHFPFRATQLVVFLEIVFFFAVGLLPWINQFTNCCGLFSGLVVGLLMFQPCGSTYNFTQLYRQSTYLVSTNETKSKVLRTIQGGMYHLNLPIRRRIIPGILLCTVIGFSASNFVYLFYSSGIGDLPCRSCHYIDCVPWPETIYQQCEPCNYIEIEYVTIEESTNGDKNEYINIANETMNVITISSIDDLKNKKNDAKESTNAEFHVGTNYFVEMICPYGETTFFVIPNQLPQNRKEWLQRCHDYCSF